MINKINLSIIQKIKTLGEIHLIGWKRKQNNKIDQQTQQWLFGKEYFFSHYLQKYKKDTKESARRLNQNEVRVQYKKEITEYLNLYRQITQYLKQFISNYSSVIYDNFQLYNSIDRLFKYHLVAADIEPFINKYKNHDYKIIVTPEQYWRDILKKGINRENISEIIMNPLIHKISPEVKSYIRLKDHFTGWYIKKTIEYKDNFNTLSNIFHSINRYKDIEPFVLCNRINEDYIFKINNSIAYNKMFNFFDITEDLLQRMINATLNEEGRKKNGRNLKRNSDGDGNSLNIYLLIIIVSIISKY